MRRPYVGISDSQANAEALARRGAPYTTAARTSVAIAWDWRKRQPRDLREAVRMARAAHVEEVPTKLHEVAIGEGGTPRFTARAEGYIFGSGSHDDAGRDAETGTRDLVGYLHTPFRARLESMAKGDERERKRAAIVSHITLGGQEPFPAAVAEGVPAWCAKLVAEDALRHFLHGLSDLRLHVPVAESVTAA